MIELRWVERTTLSHGGGPETERVLQYRTWAMYIGADGNPVPYREQEKPLNDNFLWIDWCDVPVCQE